MAPSPFALRLYTGFVLGQTMDVEIEFASSQLETRFTTLTEGVRVWGEPVARAYQRRVNFLAASATMQQLRDQRSLHLHQLAAPWAGKCSIRVQDRWRLIVSISGSTIRIEEVMNHYGD